MAQRLAAATTLRRAISNRRLSTGWVKSLFLHRGVNNDALEFALLDGADIHCGVDGGTEQLFQAGLAKQGAKASDLAGVTRRAGVKVLKTGKVLPVDVLRKALHQFFIAEVKAVLEQGQCDHEPHARAGSACIAGFTAADADNGAGQVWRFFALLERALFVRKLRRYASLHSFPRQTGRQYRQWMAVVDHLIEATAKEVIGHWLALQNTHENSQFLNQYFVVSGSRAIAPKLIARRCRALCPYKPDPSQRGCVCF